MAGPFHREVEQANLLDLLKKTPDSMLLVLGPCSSGKTRLLQEVLLSGKLDTPVSWVSGRDEKLENASIMAQALTRKLMPSLMLWKNLGKG